MNIENPEEGQIIELIQSEPPQIAPWHLANSFLRKGYAIMPEEDKNPEKLALYTVNPGKPEERFYIIVNGKVSLIDTPEEETQKNQISLNQTFIIAKINGREYPE